MINAAAPGEARSMTVLSMEAYVSMRTPTAIGSESTVPAASSIVL
jgi:hypothetical protein